MAAGCDMARVAANYQQLCRAAASHPRWQAQWVLYRASTIGMRFCSSETAMRRLDEVMAAGMQERHSISSMAELQRGQVVRHQQQPAEFGASAD